MCKLAMTAIVLVTIAMQRCDAQEASLELVAAYLETYDQYTSISYKGDLLQPAVAAVQIPIVKGLQVRRTFDAKYDFKSRDYWLDSSHWIAGKDIWTRQVRGYIDNVEYGFMDDESPSLSDSQIAGGDGVIREVEERNQFGGPEFLLGASITMGYSECLDLKTLVERLPVLVEGDAFEIQNIFRWQETFPACYHLRFGLDESKGSIPSWYELVEYNRHFDKRKPTVRYEVKKFHQDAKTSLWIPVESVFYREGEFQTMMVVDESTILVNENPPRSEYLVKFPRGKAYVDNRTRQLFLDGEMLGKLDPLPTPYSGISRSGLRIGGVTLLGIAVFLVGGCLFYQRRHAAKCRFE